MQDEYLTRCVVDPLKRKFYLYSSEGDEKTVDCENMEEFMNVLHYIAHCQYTLEEMSKGVAYNMIEGMKLYDNPA